MDGAPDKVLAAEVRRDRTELGILLKRAMSGMDAYPAVTASLGAFAAALLPAEVDEPHPPSQADIVLMRELQLDLRGSILSSVYGRWFWKLFRYPIS